MKSIGKHTLLNKIAWVVGINALLSLIVVVVVLMPLYATVGDPTKTEADIRAIAHRGALLGVIFAVTTVVLVVYKLYKRNRR